MSQEEVEEAEREPIDAVEGREEREQSDAVQDWEERE
jgi:hypothetical protein